MLGGSLETEKRRAVVGYTDTLCVGVQRDPCFHCKKKPGALGNLDDSSTPGHKCGQSRPNSSGGVSVRFKRSSDLSAPLHNSNKFHLFH